jgi:hypothetical protein
MNNLLKKNIKKRFKKIFKKIFKKHNRKNKKIKIQRKKIQRKKIQRKKFLNNLNNLNNLNEFDNYIKGINNNSPNFKYIHSNNLKSQHRFKCFVSNKILKNIIIKDFGDIDNIKETVLIEFRPLPNLEFLIRNTILKLNNWNHTIICGNINYDFIKNTCEDICKNINSKINIIKLDIDNLNPSQYSQLLVSSNFWNNIKGEKILIYQEDTMLFHNNIEPFMKYDYIGAPWPINQDDNLNGVGNGGFSLRTKSVMLKCIEKILPHEINLGKSTINYIKSTNSTFVPEDVYFSKSMIDYKIGNVADRNTALNFSQETQKSINPLGGHNFWIATNNLNKMYVNNFLLKTNYYLSDDHIYGWSDAIKQIIQNNIVELDINNYINQINLIDCMEKYFVWDKKEINQDWYGIIHFVCNLEKLFSNMESAEYIINKSKNSLNYCKGIITLSESSKKDIKNELNKIGYNNIPVYTLKHPICKIDKKFNLENFIKNKNYNIIQLGKQYRKISTIYTIKSNYPKMWLSGNKNQNYKSLNIELKYLNINKTNDVLHYYAKSIDEYIELLLNNIIIVPLWHASANNSLLECLEMNIPFFITRLDTTEEYLGINYPMFYVNISEIEDIINDIEKLHQIYIKTYNYLVNFNKNDIRYEHFNSELLKIIN